ncbi:serine hydrolase domain-containing protein [Specibacter sp. RAF43]|uniref:serine hydrolase domain-containing protein n=1 Tax=Specibacter sp. RAF43 TaxID=3233057 RepID=UPI003F99641C
MNSPLEEVPASRSHGFAAAPFASVRACFDAMLDADPGYGAQLAVYRDGTKVLDLWGGPGVAADSVTGVFSCSKGVAALAFSLLVQDGVIDLDAPVAAYWPEFAQHGKGGILVRELLSHQGGLVGVPGGVAMEDYNDLPALASRLAAMAPLWRPGSGTFGYHALTMGVFLEELCRRTAGVRLQDLYNRRIREPYAADMYLGLPESEEPRFRPVTYAADPAPAFLDPESLGGIAANVRAGTLLELPNIRSIRAAGSCSGAGVGSADGLARVYAAAATGLEGRPAFLTPATIAAMATEQVWGLERGSGETGAFAVVFMKSHPRMDYGSSQAFGHDGANAALGFADPAYGLGFGYVPGRVEPGATPGRGMQLSAAVRRAILAG